MEDLSTEHRQQVEAFVQHMQGRADRHTADLRAQFTNSKDMLLEETYSKTDVTQTVDSLRDLILGRCQEAMQDITQRNVGILRQLFLQAEGQSATINLSSSALDNEQMLQRLPTVGEEKLLRKGSLRPKLASLGSSSVDVKMVSRVRTLEADNKHLTQTCAEQELKITELSERLQTLQKQFGAAENESKDSESKLETVESELSRLRNELAMKDKELQTKLSESKQFQDLKRMVQKKNTQLKQARVRIAELES